MITVSLFNVSYKEANSSEIKSVSVVSKNIYDAINAVTTVPYNSEETPFLEYSQIISVSLVNNNVKSPDYF